MINFAVGIRGNISNNYTGKINDASTFLADIPTNSGTIVNIYGLLIEDHSNIGSIDSFNIYSIGTNSQNVFEGDIEISTGSRGLIIHSPNGSGWRINIDNLGVLSTNIL